MDTNELVKIEVYVPNTHAEQVREAMGRAGAGRIGSYDMCSFTTQGIGRFRPLEGSHPFLGEQGKLEMVREVKLEMACISGLLTDVIAAMKASHPYEIPAFFVLPTLPVPPAPSSR